MTDFEKTNHIGQKTRTDFHLVTRKVLRHYGFQDNLKKNFLKLISRNLIWQNLKGLAELAEDHYNSNKFRKT